jgi:hypothetical protein
MKNPETDPIITAAFVLGLAVLGASVVESIVFLWTYLN